MPPRHKQYNHHKASKTRREIAQRGQENRKKTENIRGGDAPTILCAAKTLFQRSLSFCGQNTLHIALPWT